MTACADFLGVDLFSNFGSAGVAPEAQRLSRELREIAEEQMTPVSTQSRLLSAIAALQGVAKECGTPGWDGYESQPIDPDSIRHAFSLLVRTPARFPFPEIGVDPDGEVSLEWYRNPCEVLSVSVGPRGELSYAGLFGRSKVHGTEFSCAGEMPAALVANLERLYPRKRALFGLVTAR